MRKKNALSHLGLIGRWQTAEESSPLFASAPYAEVSVGVNELLLDEVHAYFPYRLSKQWKTILINKLFLY